MKELHYIALEGITLASGLSVDTVHLSYEVFGPLLGSAPVVLVNHALTGNSHVSGENGWWYMLVGPDKTIDTHRFTVLAFNIPGNGYDDAPENLVENYRDYAVSDIASLFWGGLFALGIEKIFAVIGGSLGGSVAWEMAAQHPERIKNLIPVAAHWKATDWVIAHVLVQDRILNHSDHPVEDARIHAMLLYRTPESLGLRFVNAQDNGVFAVEKWLDKHGVRLRSRFRLSSYKLMNHLLKTCDITRGRADFTEQVRRFPANIHIIAIDTDLFYTAAESRDTFNKLRDVKDNVAYDEIRSVHGHDAFLIETEQMSRILSGVFAVREICK